MIFPFIHSFYFTEYKIQIIKIQCDADRISLVAGDLNLFLRKVSIKKMKNK